jgi:hypothetical protein
VHLGVVYPESLDFDHRVAGLRLGVRKLFDHQMFNTTKSVYDDRTHKKSS